MEEDEGVGVLEDGRDGEGRGKGSHGVLGGDTGGPTPFPCSLSTGQESNSGHLIES